jgi:hypothetical protein
MTNLKKGKWLVKILGFLQGFIVFSAFAGGAGFVFDPSGKAIGMTIDMLEKSPFVNFLIPGLILLIVLGVGNLLATILTFKRHHFSGSMAILLGIVLVIWICVQVYWIGLGSFLQLLYLIFGLMEFALGYMIFKQSR